MDESIKLYLAQSLTDVPADRVWDFVYNPVAVVTFQRRHTNPHAYTVAKVHATPLEVGRWLDNHEFDWFQTALISVESSTNVNPVPAEWEAACYYEMLGFQRLRDQFGIFEISMHDEEDSIDDF